MQAMGSGVRRSFERLSGNFGEELSERLRFFFLQGAGTWTAPAPGVLYITAQAAGGQGWADDGGNNGSGGAGATGRKRVSVRAGDQLLYSVGGEGRPTNGRNAADLTVTLPTGLVLTLGGGRGGTGIAGGAGGVPSGEWDAAAAGGKGGFGAAGSATSPAGLPQFAEANYIPVQSGNYGRGSRWSSSPATGDPGYLHLTLAAD